MSMPGYRDQQKQTILRVARDILATEGLSGLQARRVAQASDCSVGTIYNLYGNLDMVVIHANALTLGELRDDLVRSKMHAATLDQQLDALARAYLAFAVRRTPEWRALFEHRFASKTTVPDWYREAQAELFEIVEEVLRTKLPSDQSRHEAARALFSAVHGVVAISLDQLLGAFDQAAAERQVRFIVRSIAQGINEGRGN